MPSETFRAILVDVPFLHPTGKRELLSRYKWAGTTRDLTYLVGYCLSPECKGHDTPEEARDHYRLYLVKESLVGQEATYALMECAVCRNVTLGYATTPDGYMIPLCESHNTYGVLASLVDTFDSPDLRPAGVIQIEEYLALKSPEPTDVSGAVADDDDLEEDGDQ